MASAEKCDTKYAQLSNSMRALTFTDFKGVFAMFAIGKHFKSSDA